MAFEWRKRVLPFGSAFLKLCSSCSASYLRSAVPNPRSRLRDPQKARRPNRRREPRASGLVRLARDGDVWVDPKKKLVVADGEIVLREGQLEMFACPKGTKEHESVVAVNSKAQYVHAGLLAVGAKAGRPVQFQPEYRAATGTEISVWVLWTDAEGKRHKVRAQDWVKDVRTGKSLEFPWVFAGGGFWTDETTGEKYYSGDAGDFVCVSNFPSATLDLPVQSSQANAELMFAALTERIPPLGTKVRLVFIPQLEPKKAEEPAPAIPSRVDG